MAANVVRLEVVVVHAVAVPVVIDAVPGPVQEAVAVAGLCDGIARGSIHFRAGGELPDLRALAQQADGGIACLEHLRGDPLDLFGDGLSEKVDARQVGVDSGRREPRAEVQQQQAVAADDR